MEQGLDLSTYERNEILDRMHSAPQPEQRLQAHVIWLYYRKYDTEKIADILNLEPAQVQRYLRTWERQRSHISTGTGAAIRVMVADDQQIFNDSLVDMLNLERNIEVVAQAYSGAEVLEILEAGNIEVDVILMDARMEKWELDGLTTAKKIHEDDVYTKLKKIKIIILTMHRLGALVKRMYDASIEGYLFKDCKREELMAAIHTVHQGRMFYRGKVREAMDQYTLNHKGCVPMNKEISLTRSEKEVLKYISEGLTNKKIALLRGCTEGAVEIHRKHLFNKFNVSKSVELVIEAIRHGYILIQD